MEMFGTSSLILHAGLHGILWEKSKFAVQPCQCHFSEFNEQLSV